MAKLGRKFHTVPAAVAFFVTAFMILFTTVRPQILHDADERLFDQFQVVKPRAFDPAGVVRIVDIDEESLNELGQWPWPRSYLAELVERLTDAGAAAIAFDIMFAEADRTSPKQISEGWMRFRPGFISLGGENESPSLELGAIERLPDHDEMFADALKNSAVVLGAFLTGENNDVRPPVKAGISVQGSDSRAALVSFGGSVANIEILASAASGIGSVSLTPHEGDIVRRVSIFSRIGEDIVPALSVEALRVAQQAGSYILRSTDASGEITVGQEPSVASMRVGQLVVPLDHDGAVRVRYAGHRPDRFFSAKDILAGPSLREDISNGVAGRILLVGASAAGLRDLVATPISVSVPGVEVHAEVIEQIVENEFFTRPDWAHGLELLLVVGLSLFSCLFLALNWQVIGLGFSVVSMWGTIAVCWFMFSQNNLLISPIMPSAAAGGTYLLGTVASFFEAEQRRRGITRQFEHFVSPEVIKEISLDPERHMTPGGDRRELSVFFLDVRGFSTITETMTPEQVVQFVNSLLTPITDEILECEGTVDKYMGDAVMAFWNAPRRTEEMENKAVEAALRCLNAVDELNIEFKTLGMPRVKVGIGINTGHCSVGNMGSSRRLAYSCVGDPVNLASRLEGLTKIYGVEILTGNRTASAATKFASLELDLVAVKGRQQPERVWTVAGDAALKDSPEFIEVRDTLGAARSHYLRKEWDAALRMFEKLYNQNPIGRFNPQPLCNCFGERIIELRRRNLGEDWAGVFRATEK